nr:MAG TPA_asm: hypothetical protein [Caudoviricetes sp.]
MSPFSSYLSCHRNWPKDCERQQGFLEPPHRRTRFPEFA